MKNPEYQQNEERDAKLIAAAFRGEHAFLKVAHDMGLWTSPQEAVMYARKIREQPMAYRHRVGKLAQALLGIADRKKPRIIGGMH